MTASTTSQSDDLLWLADAPLFIDEELVERFYDAVVQPESEVVKIMSSERKIDDRKLEAVGKGGMKVKAPEILGNIFSFGGEISGGVKYSKRKASDATDYREHAPISTPQRRLWALTLHYLSNFSNRIFLVNDPSDTTWRTKESIASLPKGLIFLELPGISDVEENESLVRTQIIPMALELDTGEVKLIYKDLGASPSDIPPKYPEDGSSKDFREYWKWFSTNVSATKAMIEVEKSTKSGKISWIDYRLPISKDGDTLHLHCNPNGKYSTGVFAYNLIKRGYKHGVRVVGIMKSEPDINVLAIYER